jgi:hypothetical protein
MIMQAAQHLLLGQVQVTFLKMGFAAHLHLAPFHFQVAVALGKS